MTNARSGRSAPATTIGALLRDTALQVVMLSDGATIPEPSQWRERGIELVLDLQRRMSDAGVDPDIATEISYAQCALLDENALRCAASAGDDARRIWESEPLQVKFFGSYNAGETVYQRIAALLHRPSPDRWLVDAYRTILGLGFLGRYPREDDPERQDVMRALDDASTLTPAPELLVSGRGVGWWRRWSGLSAFGWLVLAVIFTAVLGWALSRQLDALVSSIGAVRG